MRGSRVPLPPLSFGASRFRMTLKRPARNGLNRHEDPLQRGISSMTKHSITSPSLISEKFSRHAPHS